MARRIIDTTVCDSCDQVIGDSQIHTKKVEVCVEYSEGRKVVWKWDHLCLSCFNAGTEELFTYWGHQEPKAVD